MPYNRLSTSKIARAVGCHPNTVRKYEEWGLISGVPRSPKGYRLYDELHLDQMRLARLLLNSVYPGPAIRASAYEMVRLSAGKHLGDALEKSYRHLAIVQSEIAQAEAGAALLKRWADGFAADIDRPPLHIAEAARQLNLTTDILRNWERDSLLSVPRDPRNGYRLYYQPELSRLRVIRMLRNSGYSTMAIQRMLLHLDQGKEGDLRLVLDTPRPDEDIFTAADQWLTTLANQEERARQAIAILEEMIAKNNL